MIQLVVMTATTSCIHLQDGLKPGDVCWVRTQAIARELIEAGICRLPPIVGPQERPQAGPSETKNFLARAILRRSDSAPMDRFAVVDPAWAGETVVCIGGGPSVTEEDLALVAGNKTLRSIAINDAYLVAPFADISYFADARWWKWHEDGIEKSWPWKHFSREGQKEVWQNFYGQKCSIENTGLLVADPAVFILHNYGTTGLSDRPNGLHTGSNSGYQSINLAYLAGAKRIILLGYDMRFDSKGKSHSHNGHPVRVYEDAYVNYAHKFSSMLPQLNARGIEVINCSLESTINVFRKESLESVLRNS